MILVALFAATALVTPLVGCAGSGKGANDPGGMTGSKVRIIAEAGTGCSKIGQAKGVGRDGNEGLAEQQANDATRDQAAQLGGNALMWTDSNVEKEAGSGGPVSKITRTADVFNCPPAEPEATAAPATSST